ncbi:MAG: putative sugar nucleotidyl transferase [Ferruginibacter sp.]
MNIILDDTKAKLSLYPFTATRHVADIRIGILTIREKWARLPGVNIYTEVASLQQDEFGISNSAYTIDAGILPCKELLNCLESTNVSTVFHADNAFRRLKYPWQIFQFNDWALRQDFEMLTSGRVSQPISSTNKIIGGENIFIEEGAVVEHSILNASNGPIYIGKNALVMEGCMIRGAFAICEGAVLKMGSKVYGATTIGPFCNAGGEIKNSVMFGFSNKAHDGYLGDSVIGEWCNLGAGTTNSNVKNSAGKVKVWSQAEKEFVSAGLKCGILMGDYSRSAINTSFNTGTVCGVSCNIFGEGFPPKKIPDFTWGTGKYIFEKALHDISNWKELKAKSLTNDEENTLHQLYNQS